MADTEDSRERRIAKEREANRAWHAANRERVRERRRIWRAANRERRNAEERARRAGDRLKTSYLQHKNGARKRGIPFLLSFEEWTAIWIASGKSDQRGVRKGQYVMARFGDRGSYEISNVRICTKAENNSEKARCASDETRRRMSEAMRQRWYNIRHR